MEMYKRASEDDIALGFVGMDLLYQNELGVSQNFDKAHKLYKIALKSHDNTGYGSLKGYNYMGDVFMYGCGVDIDYENAFRWYLKCDTLFDDTVWEDDFKMPLHFCDKGWLNIGTIYFNGFGTTMNRKLALMYLEKASKFGNVTAQRFIDQNHANDASSIISEQLQVLTFLQVDEINTTKPEQGASTDQREHTPKQAITRRFFHVEDCSPES
ncbi:hypothetical protein INT47_000931 [Mucor saturninus]|uniref:Uncharacterized protein n=1 Tax=Mucor saturninus TaxID=64648 RepID=A0A8H7RPM2_9FUNG|nr:hypothetical protein INT47_000931 [Mucor saturninus]